MNEALPLRKTQGDLRPRRAGLPSPSQAGDAGRSPRPPLHPSLGSWGGEPRGTPLAAARGRGRGGQGAGQGQTDSRGRAIVGGLLLWGCQGRFLWRWASLGVGVDRAHGLGTGKFQTGRDDASGRG